MAMSKISGGRLSQELHPMKNQTILKTFFEFCDVETLKTCRLVCTMWRDDSLDSWYHKAVLNVPNDEVDLKIHSGAQEYRNLHLIDNFLDFGLRKPYQNIRFNESGLEDETTVIQYIFMYLRESTKLVEIPFFSHRHTCLWPIQDALVRCPNLRYLRLRFSNYAASYVCGAGKDWPCIRTSVRRLEILGTELQLRFPWEGFLTSIPNIQQLKIAKSNINPRSCESGHIWGGWINSILRIIENKRDSNKEIYNLTELDIHPPEKAWPDYLDGICEIIIRCQFPLKILRIAFGAPVSCKSKDIYSLLRSLSDTLESLTLNNDLWSELEAVKLPSPIQLKYLDEIIVNGGTCWGFSLMTMLCTPKLTKLILKPGIENSSKPVDVKGFERDETVHIDLETIWKYKEPMDQLYTFECSQWWKSFTPEDVKVLANVMPNLKHLSIPLNSRSFQTVCQSFPGLWTLNIWEKCGDEEHNDENRIGDTSIAGVASGADMTNLAQLTDFTLESNRDPILTDRSVINGFLKLPRLHSLSVNFKKISEASRASLQAHVPFCRTGMGNEKPID